MTRATHDLALLTTPDNGYDRPLHALEWPVPASTELHDGVLNWTFHSTGDGVPQVHRARARPGMLTRFMRLGRATDDRIKAFAQEFGILHRPEGRRVGGVLLQATEGEEPVEWWRALAEEVTAVYDIVATMRDPQRTVAERDWGRFTSMSVRKADDQLHMVRFRDFGPLQFKSQSAFVDAQQLLSLYVAAWLHEVEINFVWDDTTDARLVLVPGGLVGAIGLQLAQAIAGTDGLALTCRGCAQSFSPRHGNQRYCDPCKDLKEPERRATKTYRQRNRG